MPLRDITGNEINLPRVTPLKRIHFQDQMDEDNTFLPPSLSSYGRELFKSKNSTLNLPVTGIYNIDFPEILPKSQSLKHKLSLNFNQEPNVVANNSNNFHATSHASRFPVHKDEVEALDQNKQDIRMEYPTSTATTSSYLDDLMNSHSIVSNSSFKSLATTSSTTVPGDPSSNSRNLSGGFLQVHTLKKMRGSRRFGNLGPPKRGMSADDSSNPSSASHITSPANHTPTPPPPPTPVFDLVQSGSKKSSANSQSNNLPVNRIDYLDIYNNNSNLQQALAEEEKREGLAFLENRKIEENLIKVSNPEFASPIIDNSRNDIDNSVKNKPFSNNMDGVFRRPKVNRVVESSKLRTPPFNKNFQSREHEQPHQHQQQNLVSKPLYGINEDNLKKKKLITINEVQYEKLELLGKGGTSKVYKVKALTNNKIYAIKKVTFDQFDDLCVRGFKGEIDLLLKLRDEDRVVSLVDHAIGEGSIYLVMECGDTDLAHVFQSRLSPGQKMDINFVRFYSIEMLKCILAVHNGEVVHSDLKPANFLIVRGMLKIIDFGIANAVPDHTVNIYRESQIGTPNYMAPEALIEASQFPLMDMFHNQQQQQQQQQHHQQQFNNNRKNTWKVGKPSDIWSCGCIMYQMLYGKPPYGSYSGNQRIMAIMNPQVRITYPSTGLGGVKVPKSAIDLIKKCLSRNPDERPSVKECLSSDFLQPKIVNEDFIRDIVHLAVNFGINNRAGGSGIITSDIYDKLVETVMEQIDELNFS